MRAIANGTKGVKGTKGLSDRAEKIVDDWNCVHCYSNTSHIGLLLCEDCTNI